MRVWRDRLKDLGEVAFHHLGVDVRPDQGHAGGSGRADRPKEVGPGIVAILLHLRVRAPASRPATT